MKIAFLFSLLTLSSLVYAQIPQLTITKNDKERNLELKNIDILISITGSRATTTYTLNFFNPIWRDLEGEFTMPLNEGQNVSRYALDINGQLREGVVVEKVKARQTFEAVTRQRIDPGIGEITKGNFFRTKIFPIPANGTKKVVLAISETLLGDDKNMFYTLPALPSPNNSNVSIHVEIIKDNKQTRQMAPSLFKTKFKKEDLAYTFLWKGKQYPKQEVNPQIIIPINQESSYSQYTEKVNDKTYFYLTVTHPVFNTSIEKETPKNIQIYWDNSFSANKRNMEKELDFLKSYLSRLPGRKNITLIPFNINSEHEYAFSVDQNPEKLISFIKSLKNDGATCLPSFKTTGAIDEVLFFSDGTLTIGEDSMPKITTPVISITSSSGSNYSFLKRLSLKSFGEYINLNNQTIESALETISSAKEKYLSCSFNTDEITEVYPNTPVINNGKLELTGILKTPNAKLTIHYGTRGDIKHTQTIELDSKGNNVHISRIWAQKKIDALQMEGSKNHDDIVQLGQDFNIVTPNTSFIVLDRLEDYVLYKILPPDELKAEYYRRLKEIEPVHDSRLRQRAMVQNNTTRLTYLTNWYNTSFPVQTNKASDNTNEVIIEHEMEFDSESAEEEIVPVTRQQDSDIPAPPEPPAVNALLNIVEDDVTLEEELDIEDSEMDEDTDVEFAEHDKAVSSIKVLAWQPDAPFMETLRQTSPEKLDSVYFELKKENLNRPSFYIQIADYLFSINQHEMAVRVLSNVIEMDLENPELLKVVARRLVDEGEYKMAVALLKEIKDLRPEEPQSYRDLALAYVKDEQYQLALETFNHILNNSWNRFEDIKDIVLNELNNLVALHADKLIKDSIPEKYISSMSLDVRITIDWSSNDNDIDLWVVDPNGEQCYYGHPITKIGGKISRDFTQGYGPEEFSLKKAKKGIYTIYINYYGDRRQTITGPVTVYATLYTHYGTPQQEEKRISYQLNDNKETRQIGMMEFTE